MQLSDYLTVAQAAERAKLSTPQLTYLLNHGKVRGIKWGRDWMVEKKSLDSYLASDRRPGPKKKTA